MFDEEYDSESSIPEEYRHLYQKSGDVYKLISPGQLKTAEDVAKLQEALRKERNDHKEAREALNRFSGLDPDEVRTQLDYIEELKEKTSDKIDDSKLEELAEKRVARKLAPLERELESIRKEKAALEQQNEEYQRAEKIRKIHDVGRKVAQEVNLRQQGGAMDDMLMHAERVMEVTEDGNVVTRDGVGVTPGLALKDWLTDMRSARPIWWEDSVGAGSRGSEGGAGGANPFRADSWNLTEQGRILKENPTRAEALARQAHTTVGGLPNQQKGTQH